MAQPTQPSLPKASAKPTAAPSAESDRQGAQADTPPHELELVVWLEGHEPYVADFCLNADQAMAKLGIKRSRLNQISGKELRVGRIKSGRYIKPMYREEDIESYLQWTRPTASHQASKRALESATAGIETKLDSLADHLEQRLTASQEQADKIHHAVAVEVMEWLAPALTSIREELAAVKRDLEVNQFNHNQLAAEIGRQHQHAEERGQQLSRSALDIQQAITLGQQSLNLAGRLEAQNSFFAGKLDALAESLNARIDEQLARAMRHLKVLVESHEQFVATEFPGVLRSSQQANLDALLGHLDQRLDQMQDQGLSATTRNQGHRTAQRPPKQSYRRRSTSSKAHRKPSLLSHRG